MLGTASFLNFQQELFISWHAKEVLLIHRPRLLFFSEVAFIVQPNQYSPARQAWSSRGHWGLEILLTAVQARFSLVDGFLEPPILSHQCGPPAMRNDPFLIIFPAYQLKKSPPYFGNIKKKKRHRPERGRQKNGSTRWERCWVKITEILFSVENCSGFPAREELLGFPSPPSFPIWEGLLSGEIAEELNSRFSAVNHSSFVSLLNNHIWS